MDIVNHQEIPPPRRYMQIPLIIRNLILLLSRSDLMKNVGWMFVVQLSSLIFPLISVPYLVRTIGTSSFGIFAFINSLVAYFQIIVDFGLNYSASRDASISRNDKRKLGALVSSVVIIKLCFSLISLLALKILVLTVPCFVANSRLYFWAFMGIMGSAFSLSWFFQGIEKMKFVSIADFCLKIFILAGYFFWVHAPSDLHRVFYINAAGSWITGCICFYMLYKCGIRLYTPDRLLFSDALKKGFWIFGSQACGTLFSNTNIFILGLFTASHTVGQYAVAEKVIRAALALVAPICSAIYPRSSMLFKESELNAYRFLRKVFLLFEPFFILLSIALFVFSPVIVRLVTGHYDSTIALLVRIMAILPVSIFADNIFGIQVLFNTGREKWFLLSIAISGIITVCALIVLVPRYQAIGAAVSYVAGELILLVAVACITSRLVVSHDILNCRPTPNRTHEIHG